MNEFSSLWSVQSGLLKVARIVALFPLPQAVSTHSLKTTYLLCTCHFVPWLFLTPVAAHKLPWAHYCCEQIFFARTPNPASCCALYFLRDDFHSSGRVSLASTYTHLPVPLPSSVGHSMNWGEHCLYGPGMRVLLCCCVNFQFWFVSGILEVPVVICCPGFPWG